MSNLFPDYYVNSTYEIDFESLSKSGVKGVIFDIDNTLVEHGAPADERALTFFGRLDALGIKALVLSNNKEPRVKNFAEQVGCQYIYKAGKPAMSGYVKAMKMLGTDVDSTVFVGDQILTDIWGARRAGITAYLVKPVKKWKEEPQIILKRFLEFFIIAVYKCNCRGKAEN